MKANPFEWSRLDNAAKIFPPTSTKEDTKVFRFACELTQEVEPEFLQQALEQTLEVFPFYLSILRKGMFWYYFEAGGLKPQVALETAPPCAPLYNKNEKKLLFAVTYYHRRINLEVYHALSDGTGALDFLRTLVCRYLALRHADEWRSAPAPLDFGASVSQKMDDSFQKYYKKEKGTGEKFTPAYHIRGQKLPSGRMRIVEGIMSAGGLLKQARARGATLTELLAAAMICAIHAGMTLREERRPVVITVPVNLRKYFYSESARNFFSVVNIGYRFGGADASFDAVLEAVKVQFARELTQERMRQRMNRLAALEHNYFARIVPLAVKDVSLYIANQVAEMQVTAALSNLGKITMPEAFAPYIRLFDVLTATRRLQMCMCSYQDAMVLSFTSPFAGAEVQRQFFRILAGMGLEIEIVTNPDAGERGGANAVL